MARGGQLSHGVVSSAVERVAVIPEFDKDVLGTPRFDQLVEFSPGRGRPGIDQRFWHRPLPSTGEHSKVVAVLRQRFEKLWGR
jgi:hypothetical protein